MGDVTQIIADIKGGDERAADQLLKVVYEELRALARRRISNMTTWGIA